MATDDMSQEDVKKVSEQEDRLDEVEDESFPASDPQSSWAGSDSDPGQ